MGYKLVQKDKCVFHITHIKNIPAILKTGICSYRAMEESNVVYQSIADEQIQERRSNTPITCGPGGTLHDYAPLYFGARSPMLCAVRYQTDQREIIHLAINWDILKLPTTVFTDGNAATHGTTQFCGIQNIEKVDFEAAAEWYWNKDSETRRKKSAEVLVHRRVGIEWILGFFVMNDATQANLQAMLDGQKIEGKPIIVAPEFYY